MKDHAGKFGRVRRISRRNQCRNEREKKLSVFTITYESGEEADRAVGGNWDGCDRVERIQGAIVTRDVQKQKERQRLRDKAKIFVRRDCMEWRKYRPDEMEEAEVHRNSMSLVGG